MDIDRLRKDLLAKVEEYVEMTDAWEDAEVVIDKETGNVELMEAEEAEELPDRFDLCDVMDLVEMTPDGAWVADPQAIEYLLEDYE